MKKALIGVLVLFLAVWVVLILTGNHKPIYSKIGTGFGCTPEKPVKVEPKVEPVPLPEPPPVVKPIKPPEVKLVSKKPAVIKVTKEGNVYTLKLNTNKLKPNQEVHLCVGYLYFPVPASQIGADGTVKIKFDWTPPGNPRVSAGVYSGGTYVTSMVVSG
jgi:hypothetical protein